MAGSTRRRFLMASAAFTGLTGVGLVAWGRRGLEKVTRTSAALGAKVNITVLHADSAHAEAAVAAAFAELATVEAVMSLYRPDSQLCELNRAGTLANPHPYLVEVLRQAVAMSEGSQGAFDVTVQPLWRLYSQAAAQGGLPAADDVRLARAQVDWRQIQISDEAVRLNGNGTAVTLNGIAQGFAADRVWQTLHEHGIEHALVDAGEMVAHGANAARDPWRIGIQHPRQADAYIAVADLANRCLATSGDYSTSFDKSFRHNHLLDPRTGYSPTELSSVSILAPTACEADALSTTCFVLGPKAALELLQARPAIDAHLVLKNGRVMTTPGFPVIES